MNKIVLFDTKEIRRRATLIYILLAMPFFLVSLILSFWLTSGFPDSYGFLQMTLYICISVNIIVSIFYILFAFPYLMSHKKHSFIDISKRCVIISITKRSVFSEKLKKVRYKELYVIEYKDMENIFLKNDHIYIKGKIKYFYEKNSRLLYSYSTKDGYLEFDTWWFNYNPTKVFSKKSVFFPLIDSKANVKLIKKLMVAEKIRSKKSDEFKKDMQEMAKSARKTYYRQKVQALKKQQKR